MKKVGSWKLSIVEKAGFSESQIVNMLSIWDSLGNEISSDGPRVSRLGARRILLDNGSRIVVRQFKRGGMIGKVNSSLHLRTGAFSTLRPYREYQVLKKLSDANFPSPRPLFVAVKYRVFGLAYEAFLGMEEILGFENFLEWAKISNIPEDSKKFCFRAGVLANELLAQGILHTDLHPGNIMINSETKEIVLIDFDNYSQSKQRSLEKNRLFLKERWSRAVRKHELDSSLFGTKFIEGLES